MHSLTYRHADRPSRGRPTLRLDRHPMYEQHREHGGWKIMAFGLAAGALFGWAIVYTIVAGA